jgi:DNA-directed RNA polymerase specialized sigma subunit
MNAFSIPVIDEESSYRKLLQQWTPKIRTVVNQWAIPGIIGLEHDDLQSLSKLVLLRTLRCFDPTRARFSTYFYTAFANSIKTNYCRAGLIRQSHRIKITHKKTGEVCILSRKFRNFDEAQYVARSIRSRRSARVYLESETRHKRIPPNLFIFDTSSSASSDPEDERPDSNVTIDRVPAYDRRQFDLSEIVAKVNRRLADVRERWYAQLLAFGHSPEMARRAVQYSHSEAELKLRKFRRVAVGVMKELVA